MRAHPPSRGLRAGARLSMLSTAVFAAGLLAAGCSSYKLHEPATPPMNPFTVEAKTSNLAKVCVIRTSNLGYAVTFVTWDNGTLVGATRGATHFCYFAEPGEHDVLVDTRGVIRTHFVAEAGKAYFLHEKIDLVSTEMADLVWVTPAEAEKLFPSSTYAVLAAVPSDERLPRGMPLARAKGATSVR